MHELGRVNFMGLVMNIAYYVHRISKLLTKQLHGFSDADWAGDSDDHQSVDAYCIFHGNNLISWNCKQQQTVT